MCNIWSRSRKQPGQPAIHYISETNTCRVQARACTQLLLRLLQLYCYYTAYDRGASALYYETQAKKKEANNSKQKGSVKMFTV